MIQKLTFKRITALLLVLCMGLVLCGFMFNNAVVAIDTEKNPVYEYCTAEDMLSAYAKDDTAKERYSGGCYLIRGKVARITGKGAGIDIQGTSAAGTVKGFCFDKNARNDVAKYSVGDDVAVYGRVSPLVVDNEIRITVDRVIKPPAMTTASVSYFMLDGTAVDRKNYAERTLADGRVRYFIPPRWEGVEYNIQDEGIGRIEGRQYVLNSESKDTYPESFFVCYFDNSKELLNPYNDAKEARLIAKAIAENISGSVERFPSKEARTYYGAQYIYYVGSYKDSLNNKYNVEYVFQPDGERGLVMYLYVYRDPKHLSDIMLLTRFLEVK